MSGWDTDVEDERFTLLDVIDLVNSGDDNDPRIDSQWDERDDL
jgi:hypothetical protein